MASTSSLWDRPAVVGPAPCAHRCSAPRLRGPAADWCYLHNFADSSQPIALQLPTGRGPELAHDLDELIAACRREIPRVFEGEQYQQRRAEIAQQVQAQREQLLEQLRSAAHRL